MVLLPCLGKLSYGRTKGENRSEGNFFFFFLK